MYRRVFRERRATGEGTHYYPVSQVFFRVRAVREKVFFFLFRPAIVAVQLGSLINVFS